ncbi:MAG: PEGA domain-containing protein, partial [Ignavibacteria bacterium]|nr:PEGA domain-containing protein [Ignavibacteria bacterium]
MKYIFLFLFSATILFAQNEMRVVGKGEYRPDELIDVSIKDANQRVCAGLIILSDLSGLTFQAYNGIVKVNKDPGRYFLFLQPDERVVEVYAEGYVPLKIILYDYDIKFESGKTFQLKVTGEKEITTVSLNLLLEPSDAQVTLDGKKLSSSPTQQVAVGKHTIKIEKQGFKTIEQAIDVSPSNTLFRFALKEVELASVQIKSTPTGAKILIDNSEKGETNKGLWLYPGTYKLKLTLAGYLDTEKNIEVKEGEDNNFTNTLLKNSGAISIDVTPNDAEIKLNDQTYNSGDVELKPGNYTLLVTKSGYLPHSENVEIKRGEKISRDITLTKNSGTISIDVTPNDAEIKLNDQTYNSGDVELKPGNYTLLVTKNGYLPHSENVEIK